MSSLSGQVAAAVVAKLSESGFRNAELSYCPSSILADNPECKIYVTPVKYGHSMDLNRVSKTVEVSVILLTAVNDQAEFEEHNATMEHIADMFFKKQLPGLNQASCFRFSIDPMGSEQRYRESRQYLGAIELEFLVL